MKILIVGNGGREHALLWKLRQDAPEADFYITRGNGGTNDLATPIDIPADGVEALVRWAAGEAIDLTVVGPEIPLAAGIVDGFEAEGLPIFGPSQAAAEIESSKAFSKDLMRRYGIPTAEFEVFTAAAPAVAFARRLGAPVVVKASGLAAGKGAVVCATMDEAVSAIEEMLEGRVFGTAGDEVVVEEFMRGEELSIFAISDGATFVPLLPAQDHKRIGEGDTGPNTGGMGAYAPVSIATSDLLERIEREIVQPTIDALADEGRPYRGVLYVGIMVTPDGPKVVEFNCRFGDPETEVLLPLMESSLLEVVAAVANRHPLAELPAIRWKRAAAVTSILAAGGYPGKYSTGIPIHIPPDIERDGVVLFHAGTNQRDGSLVTSGGRVLAVTAVGDSVASAAAKSRSAAERIQFEGCTFRRDIGWREIERRG